MRWIKEKKILFLTRYFVPRFHIFCSIFPRSPALRLYLKTFKTSCCLSPRLSIFFIFQNLSSFCSRLPTRLTPSIVRRVWIRKKKETRNINYRDKVSLQLVKRYEISLSLELLCLLIFQRNIILESEISNTSLFRAFYHAAILISITQEPLQNVKWFPTLIDLPRFNEILSNNRKPQITGAALS